MRLTRGLCVVSFAMVLAACSVTAPERPDPSAGPHDHPAGETGQVGRVHFPITCRPAVQPQFEHAVALLHSFWYDEAGKAFRAIADQEPDCAMAFWGVAMSLYHPLWEPPDSATLKTGWAAVEKAKAAGSPTERERGYIAAIEAFYRDWVIHDHRTRALAYEKTMERLTRRYPEDREAAAFYALALNGTASPADKTYANQRKAGEILERLFAEQPDHPGVAHYLIHSYDAPPLAARAVPAAQRYAAIAPGVPHALHMPSHIFIRLGMWQDAIDSNLASAAARRETAKVHPEAASFHQLHAMDYLMYAYLQTGQDREATAVLEELNAIQKAQPENLAAAYALTAIPARHIVERRRWADAKSLVLHPGTFAWGCCPQAEANFWFARVLGAARRGDVPEAQKDLERFRPLHEALVRAKQPYWADQVEIQHRMAAAWLALAEGKQEEAVKLMQSAAELEDLTGKHPVTPGPIVPARELLGDLLMVLKQPKPALQAFHAVLQASPNRFNALYGAARAARLVGRPDHAKAFYARLVATAGKDSDRAELREAKAVLNVAP